VGLLFHAPQGRLTTSDSPRRSIFDKLRKLGWETEFLDDPYVHFELSKDSQVEKREALTEEGESVADMSM
jgi:hypothetical protein